MRRRGPLPRSGRGDARATSGSQNRLLASVFAVAAAVTAILSLDATVVLLTPVVPATARTLAVPARPHAYATAHLANSASLLLQVSNLTNLLAFSAAGLSFLHFVAVMTLPWLAAIVAEFVLLGIAALAAMLSNVVNNLPAVLVLLPLVTVAGPAAVLAVLIGVNIGPNLTYVGSLANLLWRAVVRHGTQLTVVPVSANSAGSACARRRRC